MIFIGVVRAEPLSLSRFREQKVAVYEAVVVNPQKTTVCPGMSQ